MVVSRFAASVEFFIVAIPSKLSSFLGGLAPPSCQSMILNTMNLLSGAAILK